MSSLSSSAFLICNPISESGTLDTLPVTNGLQILSKKQLEAKSTLRFSENDKICLATESVLDDVLERLDDRTRKTAVLLLKDKFQFRQLLQSLYPDFYFKQCLLEDLHHQQLDQDKKYVVKPVKGCFGSGVRIIDGKADISNTVAEIKAELAKNAAVLSSKVLTPDEFIIESYVEGEEYAVDMFYDSNKKPVITNICHHPMPKNLAYLHMFYYSSQSVFQKVYDWAKEFFTKLNKLLNVSNLPIHAEFRMQKGQIIPIELNPLRFGGMGLGNLGYHTLGINAYQCFINDTEPEWEVIWQKNQDVYGFFIAYNGANSDITKTKPDWKSLRQRFRQIIFETSFDYNKQLAFGVLYIAANVDEIPAFLTIEFDDYFIPLTNLSSSI